MTVDNVKMTKVELPTVINELCEVRHKWFDIVLQLKLNHSELKSIEDKYRNDPGNCFREMLNAWQRSSSQAPKTWSTLAKVLRQPSIKYEELAKRIEEKYCKIITGKKRPHPSTKADSPPKRSHLEEGCNCQELKKQLEANDQHMQELNIRLDHLETSMKHQDVHIQALQEDNDTRKKENAKLECQYSKLEKQVKEHSEQIQQLTTQLAKEKESTPKPSPTQTNEIDDNILWVRHVLHDVREDWYEIGCEFEVGLSFLDDIKSKHSEDSKHCLFLVIREWLTQLVAEDEIAENDQV